MSVQQKRLGAGTTYATPYYEILSGRKGPSVMIVAGIHGNETASIGAAKKLAAKFSAYELALKKGSLVIVPIANQQAYRARVRGKPDLNRQFPRKAGKPARHPLAAALFELAKRWQPAWYLDLHEANGLSQINPHRLGQTLITHSGSRAIPAARKIMRNVNRQVSAKSRRFNLRQHALPGSSRTAAARILKSRAVTVETCWSLKKSERVNYQLEIATRFLREAGLL
ncbi:succinylglutamate desuccinylase/aspartoacylase family protein [Paenibacillus sp. M1]|uniref:Succinylglutamate desuccinylase/aspartoacylase family protein n=1 Tax=Paenibacillus haidiansis TaxID=1574488 RepID=A0ABU7VQF7_9BACL